MDLLYISHPDCALHDMGRGHPESPARLRAIRERLTLDGLDGKLQFIEAPLAERSHLYRVHDPAYVDEVFRRSPAEGLTMLDPDTAMNPHTLTAALRAAGAVIDGVDRVIRGDARAAFCAVRPPGHHAEHRHAMGFCIFNNVAVGAAHALAAHGLARVAIVDFDVHHGNGTEDIFRDNPAVMLCSSYQHPYYPYSISEPVSANILHVPLAAGTDGKVFRAAYSASVWPALDQFRPELILCSAGFDAHVEDPLAHLRLVEDDYDWVTRQLREIADAHAGGRIVSTLEGGYDLTALGRSVAAHLRALL